MARHANHEYLEAVARDYGWRLHPGQDGTCERGNAEGQIWMKPCAWDASQEIPVGCYCCTDLSVALREYYHELAASFRQATRQAHGEVQPGSETRLSSNVLDFLPPYRPR